MSFFDPYRVSYTNPATSYKAQVIRQKPQNYKVVNLNEMSIDTIVNYLQQNGYTIYPPLLNPFRDYRFVEFKSSYGLDIDLFQDSFSFDNPLRIILQRFSDSEFNEFFKYPADMVSSFYLAINVGSIKIDRIHPEMTQNDVYNFKIRFPINDSESNNIWLDMGRPALNPISRQDLCRDFLFPSGLPMNFANTGVPISYIKWDDDDESWSIHEYNQGTMSPFPSPSPFNGRHIYDTLSIYDALRTKDPTPFLPTVGFAFDNTSNPGYNCNLYGVEISYQIVIMIAISKN